jgi:hypothetical protein
MPTPAYSQIRYHLFSQQSTDFLINVAMQLYIRTSGIDSGSGGLKKVAKLPIAEFQKLDFRISEQMEVEDHSILPSQNYGSSTGQQCSGQRSWVLPGSRDFRSWLMRMGAAGAVSKEETGPSLPSVEEGSSKDGCKDRGNMSKKPLLPVRDVTQQSQQPTE